MSTSKKPEYGDGQITRRDFMDGALVGAGAALLSTLAPGLARSALGKSAIPNATLGPNWTGPGGIGDYAGANGNTHPTVNAAHALRDRLLELKALPSPSEDYDLVVVGGGIAGLCSCYEFIKARGSGARVLLLDNQAIFGGEAKQNEIEVDGYRLQGPQGSNMFIWPARVAETMNFFWHKAWREVGLPMGGEADAPTWVDSATMSLPRNHFSPMMVLRDRWPQAQFFRDPQHRDQWKHAMSPWTNGYRDMPWSEQAKQELARVDSFIPTPPPGVGNFDVWMDSMTYKDYLTRMVGVTQPEVFAYLDPQIASYGGGLGCANVSAFAARDFRAPATLLREEVERDKKRRSGVGIQFEPASFPGGNTGIARYFVKRLIPNAITGKDSMHDILYGQIDWSALDHPQQPLRMRLNATAIDLRHDGPVDSSAHVQVTYVDNLTGAKRCVRGKAVVMASGQWVNKYVVHDAPRSLLEAMGQFNYAPFLSISVAVRNWHFLDKLGAPVVRWFDSFGWFTNVRAPMAINGEHMPADPDKPTILTFYLPYTAFVPPDAGAMPLRAQCVLARTTLLNMSYRDIETKIRGQLTATFAPYGFDDRRDIAGIITNRWGHAYVIPVPGFFYGKDGTPAPRARVQQGYGRVRFSHSELGGVQLWSNACQEAERAVKQVLPLV
jgi:spermidine dehydrogenase